MVRSVLLMLSLIAVAGCDAVRDYPPELSARQPNGSGANRAIVPPAAAVAPPAAIRFVKGFEAGTQYAARTHKPMMLFFTAEWCRYCHQMAADAFVNADVCRLADRFVCVEIDADAESDVCSHFNVQGYPTVLFVSAAGTPLNRLVGQKPSRQLISAMQAALQNIAQLSGKQQQRL
jgi:thiol:disulfide interchange protein